MSKAKCLRLLKAYLDLGEISPQTYKNARKWLTNPQFSEYQDEVMKVIRPSSLNDAFYQLIPFGTGGRRGIVGVGTNRMNPRTIAESAQGLANHILKVDKDGSLKKRGVVIGFDVRNTSLEFSQITAEVLAAAKIKVYLFNAPRPTPVISFAIRHLGCVAGAIITASHNPPTDNGFKAYWEDGGQVVPPNDKLILAHVKKVKNVVRMPMVKAKKIGLVQIIGKKVDNAYFKKVATFELTKPRNAVIVYSPLHGTGAVTIPRALAEMGFKKVFMPENQVTMDGNFPTVANNYPNPEMPAAMDVAVKLGKKVKADIVMASDPDGDRVGFFAPDHNGKYVNLTGNQMGAMLCNYICESMTKSKTMPKNPIILTTLVSTRMARAIGESYGVKVIDDLLVGFKWMAMVMHQHEKAGKDTKGFIFGFEESIGYLRGDFARDKDSAAGAITAAQLAAYCRSKKITLLDYLDSLYEKFGYFKEMQFSKFLRGSAGAAMMDKLMETLRDNPPKHIGGKKVFTVIDRLFGKSLDVKSGAVSQVPGEKSNVLVYVLDKEGYTSVTVRPSGTEPKLKHYMAAFAKPGKSLTQIKRQTDKLIQKLADATEKIEEDILAKL